MVKFEGSIDTNEVDQIVETMKKKYREEGMQFDEVSGSLKELRGIIAEETYSKADIENSEDLESFDSKIAQQVGKFYLKMKNQIKPIQELLKKIPFSDEVGYYLYSANMPYSSNQYLALTSAAGVIGGLVSLIAGLFIGAILAATTKNIFFATTIPFILALLGGLTTVAIVINIPRQTAIARGNACSMELPFALRHMATELRAGIGLYKTIQAVTAANYGLLSEEFARTIAEVEEGTDTSIALKHMALRTQSRALRSALNHIIRAMRIGGNLSNIISEIAEEVSEEMKNKINTFSQKMNFFSVIFIFACIVLPVAIMILGAIRNSPLGGTSTDLFKAVPLTPSILLIFYLIIMPIIFIGMNAMVYITEPKM
ncbi:MAG: type II secretion system F family protein [archaeon]|jgi:flagellar protein FlaJ